MLIKDIFAKINPVISFEIFPPRNDTPIDTIYETLDGLKGLNPDFISVTYGANGSNTTNYTAEISSLIKHKYGIESLAHLTCITSEKDQIDRIISRLHNNSVENILALRGDYPQEQPSCIPTPYFRHAKDLVSHIIAQNNFSIGGACYPEGHPESPDLEHDIGYLKQKTDAGVDFLLTQLFFDNELFYNFINKARQAGIDVPISAGIMPVTNRQQIERILQFGRITFPTKFTRIVERYEHQPEALKEAGIAYATDQIIDLLSWGVDGIHLYTMNKPEVARKIMENISTIRNVIVTNK